MAQKKVLQVVEEFKASPEYIQMLENKEARRQAEAYAANDLLVERWASENRVIPKDEPDEGFLAFLERNTKNPKVFPVINNMDEWKKKNRVDAEA